MIRGHLSRPGVGGPAEALRADRVEMYPLQEAPVVGKRPLTRLVRDLLCYGCEWPDVCAQDRTCWLDEARLTTSSTTPEGASLEATGG